MCVPYAEVVASGVNMVILIGGGDDAVDIIIIDAGSSNGDRNVNSRDQPIYCFIPLASLS